MYYWSGGIIFLLAAVAVVVVGVKRMNRPKCPNCGLSVDGDLDSCPYCNTKMA